MNLFIFLNAHLHFTMLHKKHDDPKSIVLFVRLREFLLRDKNALLRHFLPAGRAAGRAFRIPTRTLFLTQRQQKTATLQRMSQFWCARGDSNPRPTD